MAFWKKSSPVDESLPKTDRGSGSFDDYVGVLVPKNAKVTMRLANSDPFQDELAALAGEDPELLTTATPARTLDQERVDKGIAYIHGEISALEKKGRLHADDANRLRSLVTGTTDKADFADCDWVIEAVFEELSIKQQVFAEIEKHVSPEAVLATNTSSLSVEQIGATLEHPERVVGFHFFNPVAVMPLIEVVKAPKTDDATLATAMATAAALKKNAVITADTPGFVVNRILAKVLGEAMHAVEIGTPFETVVERSATSDSPWIRSCCSTSWV